jgi:mRNA-degrading endonuclease RelE of RelBE toxin-antitoxin system
MKYFFSKSFEKKLDKLDVKIKKAFYSRLELFCENNFHPLLHNHSVDPPFEGARSINVTGDYRALFSKEDEGSIVFINIGTHSELYD